MRKLSNNDRLIGAILLAEKHGLPCTYLCIGVAAGMLFNPETDERSKELYAFSQENGARETLKKYSGYDGANVDLICDLYDMLKKGKQISALIKYADEYTGKEIRV